MFCQTRGRAGAPWGWGSMAPPAKRQRPAGGETPDLRRQSDGLGTQFARTWGSPASDVPGVAGGVGGTTCPADNTERKHNPGAAPLLATHNPPPMTMRPPHSCTRVFRECTRPQTGRARRRRGTGGVRGFGVWRVDRQLRLRSAGTLAGHRGTHQGGRQMNVGGAGGVCDSVPNLWWQHAWVGDAGGDLLVRGGEGELMVASVGCQQRRTPGRRTWRAAA